MLFFVADVHIGNHKKCGGKVSSSINERCAQVLKTLELAVEKVVEEDGVLLVAGDLLDVVRPEAPVLASTQNILKKCKTFILKGNHDSHSSERGDHALAPLAPVAEIIEEPVIKFFPYEHGKECAVFFVPFEPEQGEEYIEKAVIQLSHEFSRMVHDDGISSSVPKILVIHAGISDETTSAIMTNTKEHISVRALGRICDKAGITNVFAGNWHDRKTCVDKTTNVVVHQIGALCPTGWNNPGIDEYGSLSVYTGPNKHPITHIIPGPRFLNGTTVDEIQDLVRGRRECSSVYARVTTVSLKSYQEESKKLTEALENKTFHAGECIHNQKNLDKQAVEAASAARNAVTVEEAISAYVDAVPLKDGKPPVVCEDYTEAMLRDDVLTKCRFFLKEATKQE